MTALALARQARRRGPANALHDLDGLGVISRQRLYWQAARDLTTTGLTLAELYTHALMEAGYLSLAEGGYTAQLPASCAICGYTYPTPL